MAKGTLKIDKTKNFKMGDYPVLSGWAQCNYKSSYNGKREAGDLRVKEDTLEAEVE